MKKERMTSRTLTSPILVSGSCTYTGIIVIVDSESEESLMDRLFGKKMKQSVVSTASSEVIDSDNEETSETPVKTLQEQTPPTVDEDEEDCVWHDEDDDVERKKVAEMKFAEFSGAWLNVKPVAEDEENFSGKIFSKRRGVLPQGEIDIEEVGTLVIGGLGGLPISGFDFHPHAPAAMLTQADTLAMFKVKKERERHIFIVSRTCLERVFTI